MPAEWKHRWGFLLEILDTPYVQMAQGDAFSDPDLRSLANWKIPGEIMLTKVYRASSGEVIWSSETRWDVASGRLVTSVAGPDVVRFQTLQPDGSFVSSTEGGSGPIRVRAITRMLPDGAVQSVMEQDTDGGWQHMSTYVMVPATATNVAEANRLKLDAEDAKRVAVANRLQTTLTRLQATSGATPGELATFGVLARLAGSAWTGLATSSQYGKTATAYRFTWLPDRAGVRIESTSSGVPSAWTVRPGMPGELVMEGGLEDSDVRDHVILHAVGERTLASEWKKTWRYYGRTIIALLDTGTVAVVQEVGAKADLPSVDKTLEVYKLGDVALVDSGTFDSVVAGNRQFGKAVIAEFNAKQRAEARAKAEASNERWNKVMGAVSTGLSVAADAYAQASAENAAQQAQQQAFLDGLQQQARQADRTRDMQQQIAAGSGSSSGGHLLVEDKSRPAPVPVPAQPAPTPDRYGYCLHTTTGDPIDSGKLPRKFVSPVVRMPWSRIGGSGNNTLEQDFNAELVSQYGLHPNSGSSCSWYDSPQLAEQRRGEQLNDTRMFRVVETGISP